MIIIETVWGLLCEMAPWLLMGMGVAGLMSWLIPSRLILKHLGGKGSAALWSASLFGAPLPLCSCSVLPAALSLYQKGARKGATLSFLVSTPQTGVDSLFLSAGVLGWPIALFKMASAVVLGVIAGYGAGSDTHEIEQRKEEEGERKWGLRETINYMFIELPRSLATPFFIGLLIASVLSALLEPDTLSHHLGTGFGSLVLVLLIAMPMYICATGSIPLALLLMEQGLGPGAAIVLLIAGPATNAVTVLAVGKQLGRRALFSYLITLIAGSLILGWLANGAWEPQLTSGFHHHHDEHLSWLGHVSGLSLSLWFLFPFVLKFKGNRSLESSNALATFQLKGLTCQGCVEQAKGALEREGISIQYIDKHVLKTEKDYQQDQIEQAIAPLDFHALKE